MDFVYVFTDTNGSDLFTLSIELESATGATNLDYVDYYPSEQKIKFHPAGNSFVGLWTVLLTITDNNSISGLNGIQSCTTDVEVEVLAYNYPPYIDPIMDEITVIVTGSYNYVLPAS